MKESLSKDLSFYGTVVRAAFGRVSHPWWLAFQVLSGVAILATTFDRFTGPPEGTLAQSVARALATWVPCIVAALVASGLQALARRPLVALQPGLRRASQRAIALTVVSLVAAAALASCCAGEMSPWTLGALAFVFAAYSAMMVLDQRLLHPQRFIMGLAGLGFVASQSIPEAAQQPFPNRALIVMALVTGSYLTYVLLRVWPRHESPRAVGSNGASSSWTTLGDPVLGLPSGRSRTHRAERFRRTVYGLHRNWRALGALAAIVLGLVLMVVVFHLLSGAWQENGGLFGSLYQAFVGRGDTQSYPGHGDRAGWSDANLLLMPLVLLGPIFALSQHESLGLARFSRRTLARHGLRCFARDLVFLGGALLAIYVVLLVLIVWLSGRSWPQSVPPLFMAFPLSFALVPWLVLISLWSETRTAKIAHVGGLIGVHRGLWIALMLGILAYQLGVRYLFENVVPARGAVVAVMGSALGALACSACLLPGAFRRYYDRVPLEP